MVDGDAFRCHKSPRVRVTPTAEPDEEGGVAHKTSFGSLGGEAVTQLHTVDREVASK